MKVVKKKIKTFLQIVKSILENAGNRSSVLFRRFFSKIFSITETILSFLRNILLKLTWHIRELSSRIIFNPVFWVILTSLTVATLYEVILQYDYVIVFLFPKGLNNDSQTMKEFIGWLGIPYSFLISMTFLRAWERADHVSSSLRKEAQAIATLFEVVSAISADSDNELINSKRIIVSDIKGYIKHVEDTYNTEHEDLSHKQKGDNQLEVLESSVATKFHTKPELVHLKLDQKIKDIMSARKERLLNSKERMPTIIWSLLLASSVLWLILFIFVSFDSLWLGFVLIFGTSFIVITVIVTILLFNEPTDIRWNDISKSWKKLKTKVDSFSI